MISHTFMRQTHARWLVVCRAVQLATAIVASVPCALAQDAQALGAQPSTMDLAALPLEDAIVSTHGRGTRKLVVFADPDCVYCKQLVSMLARRDDITIYTFLMPMLAADSVDKAKAIWCAKDRDAAWRDWMQQNKLQPAQPDCDTRVLDRNLPLRNQHAILGTPTLVYADGTRTTGMPSALALELKLAQHDPATASTKP